ncbi:rsbT co-antagonist protein RsbR [Priestia megaterium]|uniref:STAS domain-containing protein n=1 Tax=Priestia megaterium TaxID=1404 RepID=UPI00339768EE
MKEELVYIGKKILEHKYSLSEKLAERLDSTHTLSIEELKEKKILKWRVSIMEYFGRALFEEQEAILKLVKEWALDTGKYAVEKNIPLEKALGILPIYRSVIWDVFTRELEEHQFAAITMLHVSERIDPLLDTVTGVFGQIYDEHNRYMMNLAYTSLEELSVPLVPVTKGIAIMPIIGEIDTHRSQVIMETCLKKGTSLQISYLILDISGVVIIDTMVADNLFKIHRSLKLVGVEAIITGIRPEIAQTVVKLGIDFNQIKTEANLEAALLKIGFRRPEEHSRAHVSSRRIK